MADLSIMARIGLDGSGFEKVLAGLGPKIAAAFSAAAIGAAIQKVTSYADSVDEMSQRVGISTKALQEWGFAAKQNGTDVEKLITFIERLSDAAADLGNIKGFQKMGINPRGMTPEDLFKNVTSFTSGKGSSEITKALEEAGLGIKQIGPMMNLLQSDLGAAAKSAHSLGAVMDDVMVRRLAAVNDQLAILGQVTTVHLGEVIVRVAESMLDATETYLKFIDRKVSGDSGISGDTSKSSWADFANSMIKGGKNVQGVVSGGLGLWNEIGASMGIPGAQEKADERIDYANKKFVETGFLGFMDSLADAAVKQSTSGGLAARFHEIRESLTNAAANKPLLPTITPWDKTPAAVNHSAMATDSLVGVGNFLGASGRSTLESAAVQQVQLLRSIDTNIAKLTSGRTSWDSVTPDY